MQKQVRDEQRCIPVGHGARTGLIWVSPEMQISFFRLSIRDFVRPRAGLLVRTTLLHKGDYISLILGDH